MIQYTCRLSKKNDFNLLNICSVYTNQMKYMNMYILIRKSTKYMYNKGNGSCLPMYLMLRFKNLTYNELKY